MFAPIPVYYVFLVFADNKPIVALVNETVLEKYFQAVAVNNLGKVENSYADDCTNHAPSS